MHETSMEDMKDSRSESPSILSAKEAATRLHSSVDEDLLIVDYDGTYRQDEAIPRDGLPQDVLASSSYTNKALKPAVGTKGKVKIGLNGSSIEKFFLRRPAQIQLPKSPAPFQASHLPIHPR